MSSTVDILHGIGYRVGTSDRKIGGTAPSTDGFLVYNTTNGKCFASLGGVWLDGGSSFTATYMNEWLLS
jgi:hypothetical protein